jgi:hypothetical protein
MWFLQKVKTTRRRLVVGADKMQNWMLGGIALTVGASWEVSV